MLRINEYALFRRAALGDQHEHFRVMQCLIEQLDELTQDPDQAFNMIQAGNHYQTLLQAATRYGDTALVKRLTEASKSEEMVLQFARAQCR